MPQLLLRAIITGFGYKIGAELGRYVAEKVGLKKDESAKKPEETGYPTGMDEAPHEDDPDDDDESSDDAEDAAA